jgi:1-phosphatidylinositol-4-phosphate 5-kinase
VVPNSQSRSNSHKLTGIDRTSILQREKNEIQKSEQRGDGEEETDPRTLGAVRSPSLDRTPGQILPIVEELGEASSTGGRSARSRERDEPPLTPTKDGMGERPVTPAKDYFPRVNGNGVKPQVSRSSLDKALPPLPPGDAAAMSESRR